MLIQTLDILNRAKQNRYAVGAFNVYTLEGALSVVQAAQELNSPVIIQVLPSALALGGTPLVHLCLEAGRTASIPVCVHLDHCPSRKDIYTALEAGISSVMADGSQLDYAGNINFTRKMVQLADRYSAGVEGELGHLSGTEDGRSIRSAGSELTQPHQAVEYIEQTGVSALAVCIGNIHGRYKEEPDLDFDRLKTIQTSVSIPLVLHGTSGLPDRMIQTAIKLGICKFNVNTEIRSACLTALEQYFKGEKKPELIDVMENSIHAMKHPIKEKIRLFGSAGKAF